MRGTGNTAIGPLLIALGVVFAGLLLFATPAQAHGAHAPAMAALEQQIEAEHAEHGHLGHCHGGSFCPAAAVFAVPPVAPGPAAPIARLSMPERSTGETAPTSFDPPPPRVLI